MIPRMTQQLQPKKERQVEKSDGNVWQEIVTGINGTLYEVRGTWIPGPVQVKVGDQVYVEYANNKPLRIIDFEVRRGSTRAVSETPTAGIVEQLFIAPGASGTPTVWFRNHDQITELQYEAEPGVKIFMDWVGPVQDVFWGVNNDVFAVLEGTGTNKQFHVYRIKRPGNTAANPTGGNQKIIRVGKVKVKEKLYTIKPSTSTELTLIDITLELRRNSVEPVFFQKWNFNSGSCGGSCFFVVNLVEATLDSTTNINVASVDRIIHLKIKGEAVNITVDGAAGSPSEVGITVPTLNRPTAEITSAIVNENNDLVWNVKVNFSNFAMGQGNPTDGLTGTYLRKDMGPVFPFGFFNTFRSNLRSDPDYPFDVTNVGVLDFFGHGNPGGVLYTSITETHSMMINARQGTVISSTVATAKTLRIDETTDGQVPYVASHYVGFRDLGLHDPNAGPDHGYTYGFHTSYLAVYGPITVFNMPGPRLYGVIKSDRSLFAAAIPYTPDVLDRTAQSLANNTEQVGWTTERTDGWDSHGGNGSGFFLSSNQCVESHYTIPTVDIVHRYFINVTEVPFHSSAAGGLYKFITVLRSPAPGSGFPADPIQHGIFVMVGGTLYTIQAYETIPTAQAAVFITGNSRHILWKRAGRLFLSNFLEGTTKEVGTTPAKGDTLQMTQPDFLYSYEEKKRYFVDGWNRATGALTLTDTGDTFPPKDKRVAAIGILKDLTEATQGAQKKDNHTILETALVPKAYRT